MTFFEGRHVLSLEDVCLRQKCLSSSFLNENVFFWYRIWMYHPNSNLILTLTITWNNCLIIVLLKVKKKKISRSNLSMVITDNIMPHCYGYIFCPSSRYCQGCIQLATLLTLTLMHMLIPIRIKMHDTAGFNVPLNVLPVINRQYVEWDVKPSCIMHFDSDWD